MIFYKVIQQLILPSLFIPLIIVLGALLTFRKKNLKIGRIIVFIGLGFYYIFSITPTVDLLLFPLEREYETVNTEDLKRADTIVLLLGGREADVLRASEVLRISHLKEQRVRIIVSGTDPISPGSQEALAVRRFFIARGVPAENIIIEGASRNTRENARNTAQIVNDEAFFLVTSAYHMRRAMMEFERLGANPIPAPTDFRRRGEYNMLSYFPRARHLKNADLAIHEYFGILFYKFL